MARTLTHRAVHRSRSRRAVKRQRPNVELAVKDFGPIAIGKVELRPLTVFAGPSNTGKSWLAILIYALWRALPIGPYRHFIFGIRNLISYSDFGKMMKKMGLAFFPENIESWHESLKNGSAICLTKEEQMFVGRLLSLFADRVRDEIQRCYGMTKSDKVIRWGARSSAKIDLRIGSLQHVIRVAKSVNNASSNVSLTINQSPTPALQNAMIAERLLSPDEFLKKENQRLPFSTNEEYVRYAIINNLEAYLDHLYKQGQIDDIHYLPADRGGIMHAHATVVSALIGSASDAGLREGPHLPTLSGVLGDFMRGLVQLVNVPNDDKGSVRNLEVGLTENVLSGTMKVDSSGIGYPRFLYQPKGRKKKLPLVNASSMVSELGPLVLFLQHYISPGDLLVLEEPEAHLHPELQSTLVVELVKLVKRGVRIILTTHSDWVLSELSNVVARSVVRQGNADDENEVTLDKKDVGVWRFSRTKGDGASGGSSIEEVEWDPNGAGYEAGFYDLLVKQNNDWADIMEQYDWSGEEE